MSTALDKLAAATSIEELPQIKIDIEAEYEAEKVLYDSDITQYQDAQKIANEYRNSASQHGVNMQLLNADEVIGKKYVELLA